MVKAKTQSHIISGVVRACFSAGLHMVLGCQNKLELYSVFNVALTDIRKKLEFSSTSTVS
ncbi:hypothetical protein FRX31_003053 [Thalictrum thalictroides]|uniref:Uncharacterized protein n=1 Tax=Thalictrum thalictroides TaxID=46969 RepID=A0A7J6XC43_THATH|nr:hypothetical protein FRX31_003053 [Thalictrum thalictroides]